MKSECCRACTRAGCVHAFDRSDWHRQQQVRLLTVLIWALCILLAAVIGATVWSFS